jgi:hypothetical protein
MSWFIPSVRLLSGLAMLGAFAGSALAAPPRRPMPAPTRPGISPQFYAAMQKQFGITPDMLQGARLYTYKEILAQTLADKSPDAAEVHTYLKNPVAWQQNMRKNKAYELGLPEFRLVLANGTYIRSWRRPVLPSNWRMHRFTDIHKGHKMFLVYTPTNLIEFQTPPGVVLPGFLGVAQKSGATQVVLADLR